MINVIKSCGIIFVGLSAAVLFRERGRLWQFFTAACAFMCVVTYFFGSGLAETVSGFLPTLSGTFPESGKIMLKALGISYITSITGEICTSAGENTLAEAAAFAGKVQIIILCIPLISQLLRTAGDTL